MAWTSFREPSKKMINITSKALPDAIVVGGRAFLLKTDYRVWIRFTQDFKAWKKMGYRGVIYIKYLFENDIPAFSEADDYSGTLEFAFPQNVVPHYEHDNGEDVLFYDIDGDYIYAAFMQAYHIDLISTDMHWHKFLALMNGLPDSTRLSAIMGYRAYTGEKIKNEAQMYRALKDAWMPPYEETEEEKAADEEFEKYFGG